MKRLIVILAPFILLITSCQNPVKKADKVFLEQADTAIGNKIAFFTSTIDFLCYAVPQNYWYPEEYTFQDIIDDKYYNGIRGLSQLDEDINSLNIHDIDVEAAIESLSEEIQIAKAELKEKQQSIERLDGMFGLMTFGGTSGLMELNNYLSTDEQRAETEEKGRAMPENVEGGLEDLTRIIYFKYGSFAVKMNDMEKSAFQIAQPNNEEKVKIRTNLKQLVKNKINLTYNSQDTVCRDIMVNQLFDFYEDEFPIK